MIFPKGIKTNKLTNLRFLGARARENKIIGRTFAHLIGDIYELEKQFDAQAYISIN